MALLETAVLAQDGLSFAALVKAIPWSNQTPEELIVAIRMAFALEAPLLARYLAEQGIKYHATHPEIEKIAHILAPPKATTAARSTKLDVKANQLWLRNNREAYQRKWVALHNGELIATAPTFSALAAAVGDIKGKGILLTQVS
ncbi:MAG: hypothetical protein KJ063_00860 [Anaerolineae bacterium]|nr:hypothetical protein [Anaerolineae bacterium]